MVLSSSRQKIGLAAARLALDVGHLLFHQAFRNEGLHVLGYMVNSDPNGLGDAALRDLDRRLVLLREPSELEEVEEDAFLDGEVPDGHVVPRANPIELR